MASSLEGDKLVQEIRAQKLRVKALRYLESQGQTIKSFDVKESRSNQSDNTLDLLFKQKLTSSSSKSVEYQAKASLIKAQELLTASKPDVATARSIGPDWEAIYDEDSGKYYYWNKTSQKTQWEEPSYQPSQTIEDNSGDPNDLRLWTQMTHPASKQLFWLNKETGEKRFAKPGESPPRPSTTEIVKKDLCGTKRKFETEIKVKRLPPNNIDPLDPTNGKGGWNSGLDGKMADSTASGPLWQQRPYPAPGQALLNKAKPDFKSIGPVFSSPKPR